MIRFKKIFKWLVFAAMAGTIFLAAVYISLPVILQNQIEKRLPEYISPHVLTLKIDTIGFSHVALSNLVLNNEIYLDHVDLYFNLQVGQRKIDIEKIVLSGLRAAVEVDEQYGIQIKGLVNKNSEPAADVSVDPALFSLLPDRISLKNSAVEIKFLDQQIYLPVTALVSIDKQQKQTTVQCKVFPFGNPVTLQADLDQAFQVDSVKITAQQFDPGFLNSFISSNASFPRIQGKTDVVIESTDQLTKWWFSFSKIGFSGDFSGHIADFSGSAVIGEHGIGLNTDFVLSSPVTGQVPLVCQVKTDNRQAYPYSLTLKNRTAFDLNINRADTALKTAHVDFDCELIADAQKGIGSIQLQTRKGEVNLNGKTVSIASGKISCGMTASFGRTDFDLRLKPQVVLKKVVAKIEKQRFSFPLLECDGLGRIDDTFAYYGKMTVKSENGKMTLPDQKISAAGISFVLPVQYPVVQKKETGRYRVDQLTFDNSLTFSAQGRIDQTGPFDFDFNAGVKCRQLLKIAPELDGQIKVYPEPEMAVSVKIPAFSITDRDFAKILPKLPIKSKFNLEVGAAATVEFKNNTINSGMTVDILDGSITVEDTDLTAEGIRSTIRFNDLMIPETVPGQRLTIEKVKTEKVAFTNGIIRFSIEDGAFVNLENIRFNWCGGIVSTESIRLPQDKEIYTLTLYCDRLDMAQLLEQMGAFKAEGTGTLNGRIPIVYHRGDISFDNGFLFSTPGNGGKVKVKNSDKILSGIPLDSPQFAELDVTREALKNFDYKWAKLTINTFENILFAKMELDGEPAEILPFNYDRRVGRFVRVDASHPGSHFQGIKLDINLNLPFNKVMKFGNKIQSLFKQ